MDRILRRKWKSLQLRLFILLFAATLRDQKRQFNYGIGWMERGKNRREVAAKLNYKTANSGR